MQQLSLENLGAILKSFRQQRGLTQKNIADKIQVTPATVSKWEDGLLNPGFLHIYNLCHAFDITLDELLGIAKKRRLTLDLTAEERDAIFALVEDCEQEPEPSSFHRKIHVLNQYLQGLFSRTQFK